MSTPRKLPACFVGFASLSASAVSEAYVAVPVIERTPAATPLLDARRLQQLSVPVIETTPAAKPLLDAGRLEQLSQEVTQGPTPKAYAALNREIKKKSG